MGWPHTRILSIKLESSAGQPTTIFLFRDISWGVRKDFIDILIGRCGIIIGNGSQTANLSPRQQ